MTPRTEVDVGGVSLRNPILAASGTFGYGLEFVPFFDLREIGGFVTKGLSLRPLAGTHPHRIVETPGGMLNAIGLQNVGVEAFVAERLPALREAGATVVANVFGETVEEYAEVAAILDTADGVAAIELNVSCPNVRRGGMLFGQDPEGLGQVVAAARRATRKPLWTKLTPNVTDLVRLARVAEGEGSDALCLVNTYSGMAVDIETRAPVIRFGSGGLSGPAIKPMALWAVYQVAPQVKVPVIGIGGIARLSDALEFLLVGARAVQVGTANYIEPDVSARIARGLPAWLAARGVADVNEFVGTIERPHAARVEP